MTEQMVPVSSLERHPEHVRALGMISIEIGNLEILLGELLGAIIGIDTDLSQIIYMTPQSYIGRLEILENVIDHVMKPEIDGTKNSTNIYAGPRRASNIETTRCIAFGELKNLTPPL